MRRYCGIALITMLFVFLTAGTASAAASPIIDRLQKKYAGISSMRAAFTQTLAHKESGSREQRSGVLSFKKPLLVRWETETPSPELLLVGADAIWNELSSEEITYKYALELAQDSRSIIRVITGQSRMDQDFYLENEEREGQLHKIRLYPKEPTQAMVEVLLWVEDKTDLIKKLLVYDFYGNENEILFTSQEINLSLNDSLFTYHAPGGFVVEDRTRETGAAPKQL